MLLIGIDVVGCHRRSKSIRVEIGVRCGCHWDGWEWYAIRIPCRQTQRCCHDLECLKVYSEIAFFASRHIMTASLSLTTQNSHRIPLQTIPMTHATHSDLNSHRFITPMTANAVDSNQKHGIHWISGIWMLSRCPQTQPIRYFDSPSSESTLATLRRDFQHNIPSQVTWRWNISSFIAQIGHPCTIYPHFGMSKNECQITTSENLLCYVCYRPFDRPEIVYGDDDRRLTAAVWQRPADCYLVVDIEVIWGIWPGVAGMDLLTSWIVRNVFIGYLWMG